MDERVQFWIRSDLHIGIRVMSLSNIEPLAFQLPLSSSVAQSHTVTPGASAAHWHGCVACTLSLITLPHTYCCSSLLSSLSERCTMSLAHPTSLVLQNLWHTLSFWLAFVCLLWLTGAWFGLLLALVIASIAALTFRTFLNRRSVQATVASLASCPPPPPAETASPVPLTLRLGQLLFVVVLSVPVSAGSAALITGCSSGIGRATVSRLLQSGWMVFATVRRETDAVALKDELHHHPRLHTLLVDISDERQVERAAADVQSIVKQCAARLCAVVCNAGYAGPTSN